VSERELFEELRANFLSVFGATKRESLKTLITKPTAPDRSRQSIKIAGESDRARSNQKSDFRFRELASLFFAMKKGMSCSTEVQRQSRQDWNLTLSLLSLRGR
jgi:hypothetical protein